MRTLDEINDKITHTKSDIAMLLAMGGDADITIPLEDLDRLYKERDIIKSELKNDEHQITIDEYLESINTCVQAKE